MWSLDPGRVTMGPGALELPGGRGRAKQTGRDRQAPLLPHGGDVHVPRLRHNGKDRIPGVKSPGYRVSPGVVIVQCADCQPSPPPAAPKITASGTHRRWILGGFQLTNLATCLNRAALPCFPPSRLKPRLLPHHARGTVTPIPSPFVQIRGRYSDLWGLLSAHLAK